MASDDLRERLAEAIWAEYDKRPVDRYPTETSLADALLPLVDAECSEAARQAAVKAWDTATREAFDCGWLHDFAMDDMLERNPHRAASLARQTGGE